MWSSHGERIFLNQNIESLNTDDVLIVIPKIGRENAMKRNFNLKFDVYKHLLLVNWNLKTCAVFPFRRWLFSYLNQSQKEKQSGNNADAVLYDLRICKAKDIDIVWRNIYLGSSNNAILILQNTAITTCYVPGYVAGANKSQATYENIYHSSWFHCASFISCFVSGNIPFLFFLGNFYLNKTKPCF